MAAIPKGAAIIAVGPLLIMVDEAVAARHVAGGTLRLCGNCPAYHPTSGVVGAMLTGSAMDLRHDAEEVTVDPDLAARIDSAMGKRSE